MKIRIGILTVIGRPFPARLLITIVKKVKEIQEYLIDIMIR